MTTENVYDEFEVSFDYKNVLYVCQVRLIGGTNEESFFTIEYFSPNEKGNIPVLKAIPGKDGSEKTIWSSPDKELEYDFLQTIGAGIEKHEM
jgi:hypothetical protein